MEGYLEEMLVLCQRSEEYNSFMLGKMAEACAPALLGAASENAFRSGQFNVIVRELIAYYINMVPRLSDCLTPCAPHPPPLCSPLSHFLLTEETRWGPALGMC